MSSLIKDLRSAAWGVGLALVCYYGLAAASVLGGNARLDRPLTWLGLAAGALLLVATKENRLTKK